MTSRQRLAPRRLPSPCCSQPLPPPVFHPARSVSEAPSKGLFRHRLREAGRIAPGFASLSQRNERRVFRQRKYVAANQQSRFTHIPKRSAGRTCAFPNGNAVRLAMRRARACHAAGKKRTRRARSADRAAAPEVGGSRMSYVSMGDLLKRWTRPPQGAGVYTRRGVYKLMQPGVSGPRHHRWRRPREALAYRRYSRF